ncbi:hypothetical protein [Phascolarctobacterium sp.]
MKKIAELHIGGNMPKYNISGSPTLFLNYTESPTLKNKQNYPEVGVYQGCCYYCGGRFVMTRAWSFFSEETVVCPCCGKKSTHNEIMYSRDNQGILPYMIRINIIEFTGKIELRLNYSGVMLGENIFENFTHLNKVTEKYIFNIADSTVIWQRIAGEEKLEYEIGYFNEDFEKLQNKSVLCFLQYDHKIKNGDSFTGLLKKLREAINRKAVQAGLQKKSLFINGRRKTRLLTSVLNIAHRVRFWDCENIPALGNNMKEFLSEKKITKKLLDMSIVEFWQSQGYSYQETLCKMYNLPNIKCVRKELQVANLHNLSLAFRLRERNIDITLQIYNYFKSVDFKNQFKPYYERHSERDKKEAVEIYNEFKKLYPKISFNQIAQKYGYYEDCLHLLKNMDKITRQLFEKNKIAVSKLHDWLSVKIAEQKGREMYFDVPDHILKRLDMQLRNYNLQPIIKNSQLVQAAKNLKNCCAGYKNRINSKLQLVVITDDNGKMRALLEIRDNGIYQAKVFDNKCVKTKKEINDLIIDFAEKAELKICTTDIDIDITEKMADVA